MTPLIILLQTLPIGWGVVVAHEGLYHYLTANDSNSIRIARELPPLKAVVVTPDEWEKYIPF